MQSSLVVQFNPKCVPGSNPTEENRNDKLPFNGVFLPDDMEMKDDACSALADLMKSQPANAFRCTSWEAEDESKSFTSSEGDFALMNVTTDFDSGGKYIENGCSIEIQYLLGGEWDFQGSICDKEKEKESFFLENAEEENFSTELEAAEVLKMCALNSWHAGNREEGVDVFSSNRDEEWFIESLNL